MTQKVESRIYSRCYRCNRIVWIERPKDLDFARGLIRRARKGHAVCKTCESDSNWQREKRE